MKKSYSRVLCTVFCAVILIGISSFSVSANSAQKSWKGISSTGAIITDEQSPVEVEKEILSFDLHDFPPTYFQTQEEYLNYSASVSAEYTFYNPSDTVITATLLFPFGNEPFYANNKDENTGEYRIGCDTQKFDITVNGKPIRKSIRYSYTDGYSDFDLHTDLGRLHDGYIEDDFFAPDLPVTRYTYEVLQSGSGQEEIVHTILSLPRDCRTRRYFTTNLSSVSPHEREENLGFFLNEDSRSFTFYCIGKPLEKIPSGGLYPYDVYDPEADFLREGSVQLLETESMSFEDFVFSEYAEYPEDSEILREDWYNAVLIEMISSKFQEEDSVLTLNLSDSYHFVSHLMRWYEYDITLSPGEHLVNTVTAPIYPGIDQNYDPPLYTYSYLLSPASTWKKFGTFEAQIHTNSFLVQPDELMAAFEKTDFGYQYTQESLPKGEMNFTLSDSENPSYISMESYDKEELLPNGSVGEFARFIHISVISLCAAVLLVMILLILYFYRKKKQRKNKD